MHMHSNKHNINRVLRNWNFKTGNLNLFNKSRVDDDSDNDNDGELAREAEKA